MKKSPTPSTGSSKTGAGRHQSLLAACYAIRTLQLDNPPDWSNVVPVAHRLLGQYWSWAPETLAGFRQSLKTNEKRSTGEQDDQTFIAQNLLTEDLESMVDVESAFKAFRRQRRLFQRLLQDTLGKLQEAFLRMDKTGLVAASAITRLLGLSVHERRLVEFLHCKKTCPGLSELLSDLLPQYREGLTAHAAILDIPETTLRDLLDGNSRLCACGLINVEKEFYSLDEMISSSETLDHCLDLETASPEDLFGHFLQPIEAGSFGSTAFRHIEEDWQLASQCLNGALSLGSSGINILLYGESGTGKTEFIRGMLTELGLEGYAVGCRNKEGESPTGRERLSALKVSQYLLAGRNNAVLLMDEAEDIFPVSRRGDFWAGDESEGVAEASKSWMTAALENNTLPVVWISNKIKQIDPAYLRRMQLHVQFKAPPAGSRRAMLESRFAHLSVSTGLIDELSQYKDLTPADIDSAARLAELCAVAGNSNQDAVVRRQLQHSCLARGKSLVPHIRNRPKSWSLDFLNLKLQYPVEKVIGALQKRQRGSVCLYGVPGTGKTALVEYMAERLGMPLHKHPASELFGKYVGETEKRIAAVFADAAQNHALLFLDEADSFFQSRESASHGWEITQVNEILQRMETFPGVLVCATNLFRNLDAAVLRRFTFKVEFLALRPEQREALFVAEALHGERDTLSLELADRIRQMDGLTPGDFHVVREQCEIMDEALSPKDWLNRLQAELNAKQQGHRSIGFSN